MAYGQAAVEAAARSVHDDSLFAPPVFFIFLRESVEAAVILAVMLSLLRKIVLPQSADTHKHLAKQVWIGTGLGVVGSLVIAGIVTAIFFAVRDNALASGDSTLRLIFIGVTMFLAAIIITTMAFTMLRVEFWQLKWEAKLEQATRKAVEGLTRRRWALILLPFTVVIREGLETVLLIAGTAGSFPWQSIPIPAATGLLAGIVIGWILYRFGNVLAVKWFFKVSTVFLLFIAAGLTANGSHEFEELNSKDIIVLWRLRGSFWSIDENAFMGIMHALFGYTHIATLGSTLGYFGYWVLIIPGAIFYNRRLREKHSDWKRKHEERKATSEDKAVLSRSYGSQNMGSDTVDGDAEKV